MDSLVLLLGYLSGTIPGIIVATSATITGVLSEALYTGLRVRPVLQHDLQRAEPVNPPLTLAVLLNFYVPLAVTVLLTFLIQPLISAALSRMPEPLPSLAVWPVLIGLLNIFQSVGLGYNEAVIALLDEPHAVQSLRRFTRLLVVVMTGLLIIMAATPLASLWFREVAGLSSSLADLAQRGLWLAILLPALRILQSWYQGSIVYSRHTRGVTESVVVFLLASGAVLGTGVLWNQVTGLYVGMAAFAAGFLAQTVWLWVRARPAIQAVQSRDTVGKSLSAVEAST
jgi:hypothetical protein